MLAPPPKQRKRADLARRRARRGNECRSRVGCQKKNAESFQRVVLIFGWHVLQWISCTLHSQPSREEQAAEAQAPTCRIVRRDVAHDQQSADNALFPAIKAGCEDRIWKTTYS
mmetsp:Transcript_147271/g.255158  ORF Transcript_147271/g.255158 Transcript_147271/m.255158 type:complete len:113 (+) Transcript_147271:1043-1381(+)